MLPNFAARLRSFSLLALVCVTLASHHSLAHAQTTPTVPTQLGGPSEDAESQPSKPAEPSESSDELAAPEIPASVGQSGQGATDAEKRLQHARDERANAYQLLPWLTLGIGAGAVVASATAGAIHAMTCDAPCSTPNWVAFVVVAGSLVATVGSIWVLRRSADIRQLDSNVYHLERELERVRTTRLTPDMLQPSTPQLVSWRFTL